MSFEYDIYFFSYKKKKNQSNACFHFQVVSQQKQLVLNHSMVSSTEADHTTPSTPILSNDILADSMARSKLLASTAKEMMESMSVKVDMDQETRDLIDQLESITMEEVERGEIYTNVVSFAYLLMISFYFLDNHGHVLKFFENFLVLGVLYLVKMRFCRYQTFLYVL